MHRSSHFTARRSKLAVAAALLSTLTFSTVGTIAGSTAAVAATRSPKSLSLAAKTKTVKTDRITMAYRQFGKGRDLVFVTGFSCTMDDWDPILLDALAKTHRITVFNHDGVGGTQASGVKDLNARILADDMSSLFKALKLNKPDVVAISLGAIVTQDFAINHPDQLNRLVLGGSATSGPAFVPPGPEIFAALEDTKSPVHDIWKHFFTTENQYRIAPWIARLKQRSDYREMTITESLPMRAVLGAFLQTPTPQNLAAIKARTMVAVGENDIVTLPANSKYIADNIPGAVLVTYPGAGHAFSEQYAAKFAADINTFLKKK
jgi:pimeloyl-ACP methyl ester carboxylesterase